MNLPSEFVNPFLNYIKCLVDKFLHLICSVLLKKNLPLFTQNEYNFV